MTDALTLVSAPAGFGKTTVLAQWLAESGTPAAWRSLEPDDNEPVRFLSYVIATLQTLDPSIGVTALSLLCTPQPAPPETVLARLVETLGERELEVLHLIAVGASNEEIAEQLMIAIGTVKRHVSNIFGKLTVSNRTQAVARAQAIGLL